MKVQGNKYAYVMDKIDEEGVHNAFTEYSDFSEVDDPHLLELILSYKNAATNLLSYINMKADEVEKKSADYDRRWWITYDDGTTELSKNLLDYILNNSYVDYSIPDIADILKSFHRDFNAYAFHAPATYGWALEDWYNLINDSNQDYPDRNINELASYFERFKANIAEY